MEGGLGKGGRTWSNPKSHLGIMARCLLRLSAQAGSSDLTSRILRTCCSFGWTHCSLLLAGLVLLHLGSCHFRVALLDPKINTGAPLALGLPVSLSVLTTHQCSLMLHHSWSMLGSH